jgi:hypothetical protein
MIAVVRIPAAAEQNPVPGTLARAGLNRARLLSLLLQTAVVAAMLVVVSQLVDEWAEGHLLAAWAVLWAAGFAGLAALAGLTRRLAVRALQAAQHWSQAQQRAMADEHYWRLAQSDPRIMAEIEAAIARSEAAGAQRG